MARPLPLAAAALGGVAYFLGYLGFGLWPLLLFFLTPLWWSLDRVRERGSRSAPLLLGLAFGAAAHAGGFAWLWHLVERFLAGNRALGLAWLALHGLWFAAGFAAYAWAFARLRERGAGVVLAGVPPLLLLEALQPQLFPVHAGAGLVSAPLLAQPADLGGPLLLTALVGLGNAAVYLALVPGRSGRRERRATLAAAVAALALAAGYGAAQLHRYAGPGRDATLLRVGVVQVNLDPREKSSRVARGHRLHLAASEALLDDGPLDLVVWPETAYAVGVQRPLPVDAAAIRGPALERARVPLLFGANVVGSRDGRRAITNSVLLAGADGRVASGYDKNILIPLAEWMPGARWWPGLRTLLPHAQDYRASHEIAALALGDLRIATPICYEVIHADFVRRMVRETRPGLLVTVANDAWFGRSREPWMHLALARLRAIEHRLPVVRATNSGVSGFIDPAGRVTAHTGVLERANLRGVVAVEPAPPLTPYARLGDWPAWLAGAWLAAFALARTRASRRPRPRTGRG